MARRPDFERVDNPALRVSLEILWERGQKDAEDFRFRLAIRRGRPIPDDADDDEVNPEAHIDVLAWRLLEALELELRDGHGPISEQRAQQLYDRIWGEHFEGSELTDDEAVFLTGVGFSEVLARATARADQERQRHAPPPPDE